VVTEAGFASDLGFEKFCHIVCRIGGFAPSAAVLVATCRALKSHGGVADAALNDEDRDALKRGAENLAAHIDIVRAFGVPCVVAINRFPSDTEGELQLIRELALEMGAEDVVLNDSFSKGGEGAVELANAVVAATEKPRTFAPVNPPGTPLREQIGNIATRLYGADGVDLSAQAEKDVERLTAQGFGEQPVCMAKTHLSLSHDQTLKGRPSGYRLPVRQVVPAAGAGFVVALCGDMQRMPGLGRDPAFTRVDIDETGRTVGLF
jgi:formyltetrahydrofolate synthetase